LTTGIPKITTLALLLFFFTATALGQAYASKDYYLVDALNLATLNRILQEPRLKIQF